MLSDLIYEVFSKLRILDLSKTIIPGWIWRPFRLSLRHQIIALEGRKSDCNLCELKKFPEMRNSAWSGLGSLAYEIVQFYRPKVIVELGTHMGLSALAMGLALRDLDYGGRLFAVDSWKGDEQAGFYGEEVYHLFLARKTQLRLDGVIVPLILLCQLGRYPLWHAHEFTQQQLLGRFEPEPVADLAMYLRQ